MNYAIIENEVVVNIIVGLPDGMNGVLIEDSNICIGDKYIDGQFIHTEVVHTSEMEQIEELEQRILEMQRLLAANNISNN